MKTEVDPPVCPYCGSFAVLTDSAVVYRGTSYGNIWLCSRYPKCDSYVGVHAKTNEPLGRMADRLLRTWKKRAHQAFDPLWKGASEVSHERRVARGRAYRWLAGQLGVTIPECHVGMFDVEQCKRVVEVCASAPSFKKSPMGEYAESLQQQLAERCAQVEQLQQRQDEICVALGDACQPWEIVERIEALKKAANTPAPG